MRKAICPQPSKRIQFANQKDIISNRIYQFLKVLSLSTGILFITGFASQAFGESAFSGFPALNVSTNGNNTEYSFPLQILLLMTGLTVLPSLVLGMTSFTRIIIVMSILRQALGTQQTPPNQVLIAISLFLTFFIMAPTFNKVYDNAALPYMEKTMPADVALETASAAMKSFMVKSCKAPFDTCLISSSILYTPNYLTGNPSALCVACASRTPLRHSIHLLRTIQTMRMP